MTFDLSTRFSSHVHKKGWIYNDDDNDDKQVIEDDKPTISALNEVFNL